ncbi:hypothetical protein [Natrinema halophilum]|uniref:Uncharacterized protein n=1 Tax=Natrinema halophilum TaxID=1699371 RepID=A0A7D5KKJ6_9EURY|nr:hypothetical protein [Natrinema halophilum]QLG49098.1 hypothetical protein HYG82_09665 [Natrinema halophilum]
MKKGAGDRRNVSENTVGYFLLITVVGVMLFGVASFVMESLGDLWILLFGAGVLVVMFHGATKMRATNNKQDGPDNPIDEPKSLEDSE